MKNWSFILLIWSLVSVEALAQQAQTNEQRIVYNGQPVSLRLTVAHEHRLVFPEPVYVDLPQRLARVTASLQPDEQVVYLTGKEAMPAQRIIATATGGERVYLVDIEIVEDGPTADYRIESPTLARIGTESTGSPDAQVPQPLVHSARQRPSNPPQIELLRHASQTLYAPTRLQPSHSQIRRAPTPDYSAGTSLLRSHKGESFDYRVVAAWRGLGRYLTAVEIINRTKVLVELDPRDVQGAFDAVAFQHPWVGRSGTLEDRTTVYLISDNPFPVSAQGVGYGR